MTSEQDNEILNKEIVKLLAKKLKCKVPNLETLDKEDAETWRVFQLGMNKARQQGIEIGKENKHLIETAGYRHFLRSTWYEQGKKDEAKKWEEFNQMLNDAEKKGAEAEHTKWLSLMGFHEDCEIIDDKKLVEIFKEECEDNERTRIIEMIENLIEKHLVEHDVPRDYADIENFCEDVEKLKEKQDKAENLDELEPTIVHCSQPSPAPENEAKT